MSMFKKIRKWIKITAVSLILLIGTTYLVIYIITENRINKKYEYAEQTITIPSDSTSIKKGEHLYQVRGCADCHGKKLEGGVFMNDAMLMKITAPNLTKGQGGLPDDYNTIDWIRTIRHGVDRDGRSLMMMPSHELYKLTDEDVANVIAYCINQNPVTSSQGRLKSIGPIGRLLMIMNNVTILPAEKIDHNAKPLAKRDDKVSIETGKYLTVSCQGCHRENMKGGSPLAPGFPSVPDITSSGNLKNWKLNQFITTIKTGKTPEGKSLDNQYMPWQSISSYNDEELESVFLYLKSLDENKK